MHAFQRNRHVRTPPVNIKCLHFLIFLIAALAVIVAHCQEEDGENVETVLDHEGTSTPATSTSPPKKKPRPYFKCKLVRYVQTINHPGCVAFTINTTACLGLCSNKVTTKATAPYYESKCQCCTVSQKGEESIMLYCNKTGTPGWYQTTVDKPQRCICQECQCDSDNPSQCP